MPRKGSCLFVCLLKNIIKQLTSFGEGGDQEFCTAPCPRFAAWPEPPAHTQLPEQAPAPLQLHFLPPICKFLEVFQQNFDAFQAGFSLEERARVVFQHPLV